MVVQCGEVIQEFERTHQSLRGWPIYVVEANQVLNSEQLWI